MLQKWFDSLIKEGSADNRDSLFGLPLHPPAPHYQEKRNATSQQVTKTVNEAIASFSIKQAQQKLATTPEREWQRRGEERALKLFYAAAQHVPAYKDFLKKNSIEPEKIKTVNDFKNVPLIDKENYLRAYPLEQLCWYGDLASQQMISVSSGSSGKPFLWPRGHILEAETALEHELFLETFFEIDQYSTLFIVCFAMGMYVAGPITTNSTLRLEMKGYPITTVTPGYAPDDVLTIIPELAPKYDQVVLAGYPPYIKEILDQGIERGIDWKKIKLRFLLAGEGFNETWRTYVAQIAGGQSPVKDFLNLYGSADAAVLAHETMASIVVRRRVSEDMQAREKLFKSERLPSFLQYHPEHKYFEEVNDELIFTAPGGIPLVRYNIHDSGGILNRQDIVEAVPELGEYFTELEQQKKIWHLPFLYIFGKSDQTVVVYGANVYPENIKRALEDEEIRSEVSGKFIMYTTLDEEKDQRFVIEIECASGAGVTKNLLERLNNHILESLLTYNSEYRTSYRGTGDKMAPIVKLFHWKDERFDQRSIKRRWLKKGEA